jgi:hypothetical protein
VGRVVAIGIALPLAFACGIAHSQTTVGAELLLWQLKGSATPPLVSTGNLGETGTTVVLGGQDLDTNPNPGLRLSLSRALNDRSAIEGNIFFLNKRSTSRSVSSSGAPGSTNLFVPVFDATIPGESAQNISAAGFFSGAASVELSNKALGLEVNATRWITSSGTCQIEALGGLRYLRLDETLTFTTDSPNIAPQPADVYKTTDRFGAKNDFFGAQLGARARGEWGDWSANGSIKVGIGAMVQTVDIEGTLLTNDFNNFGTPVSYAGGGYFATPTNVGHRKRTVFAVVPELGLTVGYRVTPRFSIVGSYSLLYISDVVRAGRQINRTVNYSSVDAPPTLPTGPQEPSFAFKSSDFWAQGISLGGVLRF